MRENKKHYLPPTIKAVAFMVENGFAGSEITTRRESTLDAMQYQEVDDGFNDFQWINQ